MPSEHSKSVMPAVPLVLLFAVIVIAFGTVTQLRVLEDVFDRAGNDDIMRMLSVRSWLAGQGWFDMTQYGFLSPEGISLHWSRYVDAGLGATVAAVSIFTSTDQAEQWAGTIWPKALLLGQILVVAFGTRRLLGDAAAVFSVICILLWPVFAQTYFAVGAVDHHNVQAFVITIAAIAALMEGRPLFWGAISGVAASFSLAVGLETLLFISALGVMLVVRAAIGADTARWRLTGFCLAILAGAFVFYAGQTPITGWMRTACDQLSPPFLAVAIVGAAAGLSIWLLPQWLRRPLPQLGLTAAVATLGLIAIGPLLAPCLAPPYAHLPEHIQEMIGRDITEALPGLEFARRNLLAFNNVMTGAMLTVVLATGFWWRLPDVPARRTVGQALILAWLGLAACALQIRQVVLLASVVPLLAGFVLAEIWRWRQISRSSGSSVALAVIALLTLFPAALGPMIADVFAREGAVRVARTGAQDASCRDLATLAQLNSLPASRVLTPMNLGPRLVMATHHIGLAAPYHRSARAMINGHDPFVGDAARLAKALGSEEVQYLVVCNGSVYGHKESAGSLLARGVDLPGLVRVDLGAGDLLVYEVTL